VNKSNKKVIIFGAGPSGLFCAYHLLKTGHQVELYDHQGGVGKKFLVAGHGGLNLTHSEDLDQFALKYGKDSQHFSSYLSEFSPENLRQWCHNLGVETFIGTSGRVFPKKLKSSEILFLWLKTLKEFPNFRLNLKHKLIDIDFQEKIAVVQSKDKEDKEDKKELKISADYFIYGLGGASWKKTGSTGEWTQIFIRNQIKCNAFQPMNCGFERKWSEYFKEKVDRYPLKNVKVTLAHHSILGEVMLTPYGIEGTTIYALSKQIREEINQFQKATIYLDLCPHWSEEKVLEKLSKKKVKTSLSQHLKKSLHISKECNILLKELTTDDEYKTSSSLAKRIKNLPIELNRPRPMEEAISTSGGIDWQELTPNLELKKYPNHFVMGEMIDFDAPTGGYLLQAAFSMAYRVAQNINSML
tara:strand:- start:111774 stop:113012 length:1239 start_codon:yes stop_codon:yes gene_type:complete